MSDVKNYYKILGVSEDASIFEIEKAYQNLARESHPDRAKGNRLENERKFHDICEAFDVLSDNDRRYRYDEILHKGYAVEDANKTFEKFYNENDFVSEDEFKFFEKNKPQREKTHYEVLGLNRYASHNEIKNAYRKLALKYHPKNDSSKEAEQKFVEINRAYHILGDPVRREIYDNSHGHNTQIAPMRSHGIFDNFFKTRLFDMPEEDEFFKPLLKKKWSFGLDRMMDEEDNFGDIKDNGEAWKESTVYNNENGVETKKVIKRKKVVKDGKAEETKIEEYLMPNGETEVVKTIESEGKVDTKKYHFKKGEEVPKAIMN